MTTHDPLEAERRSPGIVAGAMSEVSVPDLVAEVFDAMPADAKAHLLEPLLRPLGLLSLFGIAGGIFARAKMNAGWQEPHVRPEDILSVRAVDVRTLVAFVQQVSSDAMDGVAAILSTSTVYAGSAATALLAALLVADRQAAPAGTSHIAALQVSLS